MRYYNKVILNPIKIFIISSLIALLLPSFAIADEQWQVTRSRHFILHYREGISRRFLSQIIYYAERYYNEITDRLGFKRYDYWLWENRAKIYIYKDRDSYVQATGMPDWSGGRAIYKDKIIESFPWARGFFEHLLPHELGHIIFREFVGFDVKVPLWFEEGVACNQEDRRFKRGRQRILIKAFKHSSLTPLEELSSVDVREIHDIDTVTLFYAQAESIVNFLLEKYGKYNFVKLCRLIHDSKDFNIALKKAYPRYNTLEDLDEDWRYFFRVEFDLE